MRKKIVSLILGVALSVAAHAAFAQSVEKKGGDFSSTACMTESEIESAKKTGVLTTSGEAEYECDIPTDGWYEFLVWNPPSWRADIFIDGRFLIHTQFNYGVWQTRKDGKINKVKVLNLHLAAGKHTLKFSAFSGYRIQLAGFSLEPSKDIAGRVRLAFDADRLVFRKGEKFSGTVLIGRSVEPADVVITVDGADRKEPLMKKEFHVPAGTGDFQERIELPSGVEGVFNIMVTEKAGQPCDRTTEYLVIDTTPLATMGGKELRKELIYTLDCATKEPDYGLSPTTVINASFGKYRESASRKDAGPGKAEWFAYTLDLPSILEPYMLEIEYPNDDQRLCRITLAERYGHPEPSLGYATGRGYPLSNKMEKLEFYFWPRDKDPRLIFESWTPRAYKAAAARVNVYRIVGGLPVLNAGNAGRMFGTYQEEPLRYAPYFGAKPEGGSWLNLWKPAERFAEYQSYAGVNLWNPTICVYQAVLWPTNAIPGQHIDLYPSPKGSEQKLSKDPFEKDIIRLMLLTCEKHGMGFVGELNIQANWTLMRYLDKRFGGKGSFEDDSYQKPWLTVSKTGALGVAHSPTTPYYNPLYPGVQQWHGEVIKELAERYKDSPAFKGIGDRLMLYWVFGGWQCYNSLDWGYEDFSVELFEKETGTAIPIAKDDKLRFQKRYEWLMENAREKWIGWRCEKIAAKYAALAKIMTDARLDLKLYVSVYPDIALSSFTGVKLKGRAEMMRECGVDPQLLHDTPAIVFNDTRIYPPGSKPRDNIFQAWQADSYYYDPAFVSWTNRLLGKGSVNALHLDAYSFEGRNIDRVKQLGYKEEDLPAASYVYPAAVLNPPGRYYLERFANAMADGNMVFLSDGSHGYEQGQPLLLREFLPEYRALPAIGMKLLEGSGDPVALWQGEKDGRTFFYIVNRLDLPVPVRVEFAKPANVKRLATGEVLKPDGNSVAVELTPFQMIACESDIPPKAVKAVPPEARRVELERQIDFVEKLLKSDNSSGEMSMCLVSPVDLLRANKLMQTARASLKAGRLWSAWRALSNAQMVTIYEAFNSYPPGLFFQKKTSGGNSSISPEGMKKLIPGDEAGKVKLADAGSIAQNMAGTRCLKWEGAEIDMELPAPLPATYSVSCTYALSKEFTEPLVSCSGGKITWRSPPSENEGLGQRTYFVSVANADKLVVSFGKDADKDSALLSLQFEQRYREISPSEFRMLGPFAGGEKDAARIMNESLPPETNIDFSASFQGMNGQMLKWTRPLKQVLERGDNFVDFEEEFGVKNDSLSFAAVEIESPEDRKAQISFGCDYYPKIWLNDTVIMKPEERPKGAPRKGETKLLVDLRKGLNTLLIKNHGGSAGNGVWCAITDPGGLKIK
ncbi:MAG: hypothetical protein WAX69_04755 [Victivallales bacterium]